MTLDSLFRIFPVLSFTALLTLGVVPSASAQQESSPPVAQQHAAADTEVKQSLPPGDEEVTILRDEYAGKYNPSTLENLSKVYWRLGAFDFEDDVAVGNYLKINDCKVFTEYINDDLEWKEIVDVMQKYLEKNKDAFPLNFQFVLSLHLGRYDPALGGFPIVDRTGFKDAKRIEVDSMDTRRDICFDSNPIQDYPKSLIVLLPESFTLDFLKLDEHVAQAYILRKKSEFALLDEEIRNQRYERDAYLRLRITFSQYHGNLRGEQNITMAILYGRIDGYDIFEDAEQKRLMLSVDLSKDKAGEMSVPVEKTAAPVAEEKPAVAPAGTEAPAAAVAAPVPETPAPAPAAAAPVEATTPTASP